MPEIEGIFKCWNKSAVGLKASIIVAISSVADKDMQIFAEVAGREKIPCTLQPCLAKGALWDNV